MLQMADMKYFLSFILCELLLSDTLDLDDVEEHFPAYYVDAW